MLNSKAKYNQRLLDNLFSERSMAIASHNLERLHVLEYSIKRHKEMAAQDEEEERMEALRGECGMESRNVK
jgi:hypothetical protein